MERSLPRLFWTAFAATLAVKVVLAWLLPVTSDEAHFVLWGRYPAFGYFDHPPMIGWVLHATEWLGHANVTLRLAPILFSSAIGIGIFLLLRPLGLATASLAGTVYLLSPMNVLNIIVTTDTPLLLFTFLSGAALFRAEQQEGRAHGWYALAGAFLGLAFLSKYFAVLLGLAYAAYFLLTPKTGKRLAGAALLFGSAVPFIAVNVGWNYLHGWPNIMFNLVNRNRGEAFSLAKPLTFIACQAYLLLPLGWFFLRKRLKEGACPLLMFSPDSPFRVFVLAFAVPLAVFGALSFKKVIGLHWPLSFYPFLFIVAGATLTADDLRRAARFLAWFTGAHVVLVAVLLLLPVRIAQNNKNFSAIVMGMYPERVLGLLAAPAARGAVPATPSYADSALLEYHLRSHVAVFGTGSFHARHDDFLTDFREYDGKDIAILRTSVPREDEYSLYFSTVSVQAGLVAGCPFYVVYGTGFRYAAYRDTVLASIRDQFYRIPVWLPYRRSDFLEKYFPSA